MCWPSAELFPSLALLVLPALLPASVLCDVCSLCQSETLGKLVTYVTEMPKPDDPESRRFKYPYVASEVLSCDLAPLRDAVFAAPSLIVQLLALLKLPRRCRPCSPATSPRSSPRCKAGPDQFKKFFDEEMQMDDLLPQLMARSDAILQLVINLCIGEPPVAEPGGPAVMASPREELAAQSWLPHSMLILRRWMLRRRQRRRCGRGDRQRVGAAVRAARRVDGATAVPRGGRGRRAALRRARARLPRR